MSLLCAAIEQPDSWGDYGLIGLIMGSLIGLIWFFVRTSAQQNTRHTQFVERLMDEGRKERSEMTGRWVDSSDRLGAAIDRLSDELGKK